MEFQKGDFVRITEYGDCNAVILNIHDKNNPNYGERCYEVVPLNDKDYDKLYDIPKGFYSREKDIELVRRPNSNEITIYTLIGDAIESLHNKVERFNEIAGFILTHRILNNIIEVELRGGKLINIIEVDNVQDIITVDTSIIIANELARYIEDKRD